jgi:phospholipase/lecithinase/hemolysin
MKRKFILLFSLFFSLIFLCFTALSDPMPKFQHVVFFGDSLSDNGNLYAHSDHVIPKSPPYFNGRFTNGYNWADLVSYKLSSSYSIDSENYAVGGATAFLHNPFDGYLPVTLSMEAHDYEIRNTLNSKDNTLYVIWIGANDYLQGATDVDQTTTGVVNAIVSTVNELASNTNAQFLIIQLPDIALTPEAKINNLADNYQQLVTMHNQKLAAAVINLRTQNPKLKIFEFSFIKNPILQEIIQSATYRNQINKQYDIDITNVTDACWGGGLTKKQSPDTIEKTLENMHNTHNTTALNIHALAKQIQNSPSLSEAYRVGQLASSGAQVCTAPNQHLFWDEVHPTADVHKVLAALFLQDILDHQT